MANAVAKAKETAVSTDVMDDILEFAGEGASYDSSEMQIPFVRVLQAMSPQLKKREADYIDGAEQGDDVQYCHCSILWWGQGGHCDPLLPDY